MIIEEAYQVGRSHVDLNNRSIDFKDGIPIFNTEDHTKYSVKRMVRDRESDHLREERYTYNPIHQKRSFGDLYGWTSPFIREVAKDLNITLDHLPSKNNRTVPMIVEKVALGIIEEGKILRKQCEAEKMANLLMEVKNEIMRLMIVSEEHEQEWRSKIHILSPFCLLLWDNPYSYAATKRGKMLYRRAKLTEEHISTFEADCRKKRKPVRSFPAFTSCNRNPNIPREFGKVLFIMKVKHAFTVALKPFSRYPKEDQIYLQLVQ